MILKRFDDVTLADIEALAANNVPEGRTLEYKSELPGPKDDDKREFLYDVTSLANTDGGDLIFGVDTKGGVATAVPGAPLVDTLDFFKPGKLGPVELLAEEMRDSRRAMTTAVIGDTFAEDCRVDQGFAPGAGR